MVAFADDAELRSHLPETGSSGDRGTVGFKSFTELIFEGAAVIVPGCVEGIAPRLRWSGG